tara:strand:- start:593 stop:1441 length:849 start_codon:yes stop_codon:yes gene_type:complete
MIFLQNKIGSVIDRRLVDNKVGCYCCGKQISDDDLSNYSQFKIYDYKEIVNEFYSTISIKRVKAKSKLKNISGLIFENSSTGEVLPSVFSHGYFLGAFKYSKKQDNSQLDFEFDFIHSVLKKIKDENKSSFMDNLFLDANIRVANQFPPHVRHGTKALKLFPIKAKLDFEEYYRSKGGSDIKIVTEKLTPESLKLFVEDNLNNDYKESIIRNISYIILYWAKQWVDIRHGKIKRRCLSCQFDMLLKFGKVGYWSKNKMAKLEEIANMDTEARRDIIVPRFSK